MPPIKEVNEILHSEMGDKAVRIKEGRLLELSPLSLALAAPVLGGLLLGMLSREHPPCFSGAPGLLSKTPGFVMRETLLQLYDCE